jgi:predicted ABC-type ATPase
MLELIGDLVARGESFAFETTLADQGYVRRIAEWQRAGYHVTVLFLSLPSADAAHRRVRWRVTQGGHAIPEDVIRRRFAAGRANFEKLYKPQADAWALYDCADDAPVLLDWGEKR